MAVSLTHSFVHKTCTATLVSYTCIASRAIRLFALFLICSGDSGVWGLKKNFALLELLERLQNGATNQSGMAEDALKGMGEVRLMIVMPL